jgi:hypothetical protein
MIRCEEKRGFRAQMHKTKSFEKTQIPCPQFFDAKDMH